MYIDYTEIITKYYNNKILNNKKRRVLGCVITCSFVTVCFSILACTYTQYIVFCYMTISTISLHPVSHDKELRSKKII